MRLADGLVDVRPLRAEPVWRRLFVGTSLSAVGGQVTLVAVLFQVWQLSHSTVWVGAIGLAQAVPRVVAGLVGGGLADTLDRRRLVLLTTWGQIATGALLAAQALAGARSLVLVLLLVLAQNACSSLGAPARRSFTARVLPRELVSAGIALDHMVFQASMLVGPALAGVVLGTLGVGPCYLIDLATFVGALYGVAGLPALPTGDDAVRRRELLREGLGYVLRRPVLRDALLTDLLATVPAMPISLFPAVVAERFGGDPRMLGLFFSAIAVGGIGAGAASGLVTRAERPGLVMLGAVAVWGAGLVGFGLVRPLGATLACLVVAGVADTVSVIARGSVIQLATDDAYRGRVSSVELVVGAAGPDVGNLRGGLVAGATSPASALVSGALVCLAGVAAVTVSNPRLRSFRPAEEPGDVRPKAVGVGG
jgi:MFS family permease